MLEGGNVTLDYADVTSGYADVMDGYAGVDGGVNVTSDAADDAEYDDATFRVVYATLRALQGAVTVAVNALTVSVIVTTKKVRRASLLSHSGYLCTSLTRTRGGLPPCTNFTLDARTSHTVDAFRVASLEVHRSHHGCVWRCLPAQTTGH